VPGHDIDNGSNLLENPNGMSKAITPHLERLIERFVASGRFNNKSEVIRQRVGPTIDNVHGLRTSYVQGLSIGGPTLSRTGADSSPATPGVSPALKLPPPVETRCH
jgi:hypothetical protein